jgi:hypothetical protein
VALPDELLRRPLAQLRDVSHVVVVSYLIPPRYHSRSLMTQVDTLSKETHLFRTALVSSLRGHPLVVFSGNRISVPRPHPEQFRSQYIQIISPRYVRPLILIDSSHCISLINEVSYWDADSIGWHSYFGGCSAAPLGPHHNLVHHNVGTNGRHSRGTETRHGFEDHGGGTSPFGRVHGDGQSKVSRGSLLVETWDSRSSRMELDEK